jgi:hypothetical protein
MQNQAVRDLRSECPPVRQEVSWLVVREGAGIEALHAGSNPPAPQA